MSGFIRLEGDNRTIGIELGRYWGNYFSALSITRRNNGDGDQRYHRRLPRKYGGWLKQPREDLADIRAKVEKALPDLWEEIVGIHEGLCKSRPDCTITLGGLFSCIVAEADEPACSTAILSTEDGYTLVHSDEYDYTVPLLAADVVLHGIEGERRFFSISHPFQLLGSAAGLNGSFAVQGNSIGCRSKFRKLAQKTLPKTLLSRKILEKANPQEAAHLYREHPCSLPNHHLLITNEGVYSLKVRPYQSAGEGSKVTLDVVDVQVGETFCHTNHFQDEDPKKSPWVYEEDKVESPERLDALKEAVKGVTTPHQLEDAFLHFLRCYPRQLNRKRLLDMVSGLFSCHVGRTGFPYLRTFMTW
jgi:hypothetical protein